MPQLMSPGVSYLTDAGLEATLVLADGRDLPVLAAFPLLDLAEGRARLERYYRRYAQIAAANAMGFIFEAPTWRASASWGARLGYDRPSLQRVNRKAMAFVRAIAIDYAIPSLICGQIGPAGDVGDAMSADEARAYHAAQVDVLADERADVLCALGLWSVSEAIGIARAAEDAGMTLHLSFAVGGDGCLADGGSVESAVDAVHAEVGDAVSHVMSMPALPDPTRRALPRIDADPLVRAYGKAAALLHQSRRIERGEDRSR